MHRYILVVALVALLAGGNVAQAQKPVNKPVPKPNQVKGQAQMVGGNGQFGVTYTLDSQFNLTLLKARYSLDPFIAYNAFRAETGKKVFILDFALKNARSEDASFDPSGLITVVDSKGELYNDAVYALQSQGSKEFFPNLKPGQGVGQPALNDPLQCAFLIPETARIVKVIVNRPRLGQKEQVIRYYLAGATKAEAGEVGDPKNVVTPLPGEVRDPADATGFTPLEAAPGTTGQYLTSGFFALRLNEFGYAEGEMNGESPEEGNQWAIATVTAKSLAEQKINLYEVTGGEAALYELTDTDGERYKPFAYRKAKQDADPDFEFKKGDEYTFRIVFRVPKSATPKQLILGTPNSRKWALPLSPTRN